MYGTALQKCVQLLNNTPWIRLPALLYVSALVLCLCCTKYAFRWVRTYWLLRTAPRPPQRWPLSLVFELQRRLSQMDANLSVTAKIFNFLEEMFKDVQDQDLTVAYYGPQPFLVGVTPDTVEAILTHPQNLNKPFLYNMLKPWVGTGILTSDKSVWRSKRKAVTPAFHTKTLDDYIPVMNRRVLFLMHKLRDQGCDGYFDVLPVIRRTAFCILFETSLGVQIDDAEVKSRGLLETNDEISERIIARMLNIFHWPDMLYSFSKEAQHFYDRVEYFKEYCESVFRRKKADYKCGQQNSSFMDILLRMHIEMGTLSEDDVKDEVKSIFIGVWGQRQFATQTRHESTYRSGWIQHQWRITSAIGIQGVPLKGFDTVATAAGYALHLLGNSPRVQDKLREEIYAVFGSDTERPVTVDDLRQLKYLDCVVKESMRLYPPVPAVARNVDEDFRIGKQVIPRGTVGLVLFYFLHRHPRFHTSPNDFIPERFLRMTERHPFLYVPFSGGPRNCLGQRFSYLEDKILLTYMMRWFRVESKLPSKDLQLSLELVLKPVQGLEVKLTPTSDRDDDRGSFSNALRSS